MITISDRAAEKLVEFTTVAEAGGDGLRVRVVGGGCSGLRYELELSGQRKGDKIFTNGGARVYIDRKSYLYVNGTQVDYSDGLQGAGFNLHNPNVKKTCGCGESFLV
ncbi:MAG: iron-sulfur cluster assembly accessory protein [Deltaproteobacteria bacterium]